MLATPVPPDLAALAADRRLADDEIRALWLGAGIASQVGLALMLQPGRFVDPWPGPARNNWGEEPKAGKKGGAKQK